MKPKPKEWTEAEKQALIRLVRSGALPGEIKGKLMRRAGSIRRLARILNLVLKNTRLTEAALLHGHNECPDSNRDECAGADEDETETKIVLHRWPLPEVASRLRGWVAIHRPPERSNAYCRLRVVFRQYH